MSEEIKEITVRVLAAANSGNDAALAKALAALAKALDEFSASLRALTAALRAERLALEAFVKVEQKEPAS